MKEIYFIRHGETDWNRKGLRQGSKNDIPINKVGKEQALITGKYLKDYRMNDDKPFDLILCSPMIRCKETAEIIKKEIGYEKEIVILPELIERDLGTIANGKNDEELKKDKNFVEYFRFYSEIHKIRDPIELAKAIKEHKNMDYLNEKYGVETWSSIKERIKKVVNYIKKINSSKIIVISHGGTIQDINSYLLDALIPPRGDYRYGKNCFITYYTFEKNKFNLISYNNSNHFSLYNKNYVDY